MKGSKILDKCGFIVLLHSSLDTQFTMQEQMLLDLEYDRFFFGTCQVHRIRHREYASKCTFVLLA